MIDVQCQLLVNGHHRSAMQDAVDYEKLLFIVAAISTFL